MENLLNNAVSSELLVVYGLIAIVVIFIIVIIILDKRESKKKPQSLFDTLNMKIIADPYAVSEEKEEEKKQLEQSEVIDIIEIEQNNIEDDFKDLEPLEEIKIIDSDNTLKQAINEIENEVYVEDDLEKTQAQLRVEEITKALENAKVDEQIEKDRYEQFEEEQEKNAIISYNELKKSFDKLYTESERVQYLEDDEIPININELYQLRDEQEKKKTVKLEEFNIKSEEKKQTIQTSQSTFKSSPYISPVYGIQKPPVEVSNNIDKDIEKTNQFLQSLKELKSNLD